jgi:hypothetical protein
MRTRGLPILENLYIIISIIGIEKLLGNGWEPLENRKPPVLPSHPSFLGSGSTSSHFSGSVGSLNCSLTVEIRWWRGAWTQQKKHHVKEKQVKKTVENCGT